MPYISGEVFHSALDRSATTAGIKSYLCQQQNIKKYTLEIRIPDKPHIQMIKIGLVVEWSDLKMELEYCTKNKILSVILRNFR